MTQILSSLFICREMHEWLLGGYFPRNLPIKKADDPGDFAPLSSFEGNPFSSKAAKKRAAQKEKTKDQEKEIKEIGRGDEDHNFDDEKIVLTGQAQRNALEEKTKEKPEASHRVDGQEDKLEARAKSTSEKKAGSSEVHSTIPVKTPALSESSVEPKPKIPEQQLSQIKDEQKATAATTRASLHADHESLDDILDHFSHSDIVLSSDDEESHEKPSITAAAVTTASRTLMGAPSSGPGVTGPSTAWNAMPSRAWDAQELERQLLSEEAKNAVPHQIQPGKIPQQQFAQLGHNIGPQQPAQQQQGPPFVRGNFPGQPPFFPPHGQMGLAPHPGQIGLHAIPHMGMPFVDRLERKQGIFDMASIEEQLLMQSLQPQHVPRHDVGLQPPQHIPMPPQVDALF